MTLSYEDKLILSVVKLQPSLIELERINGLIPKIQNWEYLITTIIDRGISPLLYKKLPLLSNNTLIPLSVKTKLQQVYYKTFSRSTILYNHFGIIARAFSEQNIPVIALKGIYLSEWLYQDIGLRQFSDIDLLVKEEHAIKCIAILAELSYKATDTMKTDFVKAKEEIVHYDPMVLDGVSIEIHIKLHLNAEKYHLPISVFWKNAIPVVVNSNLIYTLNTTDLLIHLCIHLDKHFRDGHVQFTCFSDITNLLEKEATNLYWNDFAQTCKKYKCEDVVFKYIILVNKYMYAFIPGEVILKYGRLLSQSDEQLFIKYLNGYTNFASGVKGHLGSLKKLNTIIDKVRYIWDIVFPPKAFMIQKYNISDKRLVISDKRLVISEDSVVGSMQNYKLQTINNKQIFWWLWYPYRWWVGVKGVLRMIRGK
jgi:hypothetical protein